MFIMNKAGAIEMFKKIFISVYNNTEGFLIVVFTFLLVTDVLAGILARYIKFEIVFATELGKYIFIWLCAIGISAAARDNQHVRISLIAEKLPINRKITWVVSQLLFLVFALLFVFIGIRLTWMQFAMHKSAMGFNFPMYLFTAALPVGFLLTSVRLIVDIIKKIKLPQDQFRTAIEQAGFYDQGQKVEGDRNTQNKMPG